MSDLTKERAIWLAKLSYLPGTWDKRFARDVAAIASADGELSVKQRENVNRLAWKYRRQMPSRLIPEPSSPAPRPFPYLNHRTVAEMDALT